MFDALGVPEVNAFVEAHPFRGGNQGMESDAALAAVAKGLPQRLKALPG